MGFKKGWREYKKTKRGTAKKRKASAGKKTKKSSKSYSKASNPVGGRKMEGIGSMLRKVKLVQDVAAAAEGTNLLPGTWTDKAKNAARRYVAWDYDTGNFNVDWATPNWKGIGVSLIEDWVDGKTGHAAGVSRYAIADLVEEGIPIFRAYVDTTEAEHSTTRRFVRWTKYRTGYDADANDFDIDRAKEFLIAKGIRIGLRKSGIAAKINRRLPKKVNI